MSAPNAIQDAIKTRLAAHAWFSLPTAIGIYCQDEGDLASKIAAALGPLGTTSPATGGGLAILITVPVGDNASPGSARVCVNSTIEIRCIELPIICRGAGGLNKTAYQAARIIASPSRSASAGLHGWNPQTAGCSELQFLAYPGDDMAETGEIMIPVRFQFRETID